MFLGIQSIASTRRPSENIPGFPVLAFSHLSPCLTYFWLSIWWAGDSRWCPLLRVIIGMGRRQAGKGRKNFLIEKEFYERWEDWLSVYSSWVRAERLCETLGTHRVDLRPGWQRDTELGIRALFSQLLLDLHVALVLRVPMREPGRPLERWLSPAKPHWGYWATGWGLELA